MNLLLALIISTATLGAPPESAAPDPNLTALVRQLGHTSFAVREAAARDLVMAGTRAVPALTAGMKDKDAEVAERCKQLLPAAVDAGRNKLIARLLNEPAAAPPKGLAGLVRFLAITGDNPAARQLYAEMMAAHAPIVEALEADPKTASRLLAEFAEQSVSRANGAEQVGQDPYAALLAGRGEVVLFFFVRGDPRFDYAATGDWKTMILLRASRLKTELVGPGAVPGMKKLFLHWLASEKQEDEMHTAFQVAREGGMTEALPLALKAVNDTQKGACYRAHLLLDFMAVVGRKAHVKSLEPLLGDESGLGSLKVGDGPTLAPQVRDVALAVSIRMSGQKPADFGFHAGSFESKDYHKYFGGYGFIDDAARDTARAKWRVWVTRQESPAKK